MSKKISLLASSAALLLLAGCAGGVDLVQAGKPTDLGDGVTVTPPVAWAKVVVASGKSLTIDGVGLGEVHYYTGIQPGKPIIDIASMSNAEIGKYQATMIPNEIMDLLASNLQKAGDQNVRTSDLTPAKFGSANGFKFDLSYVSQDGLEMKGEALIAQRGGKLDVLLFDAPTEYYFEHRQPDVEQLFSTIQAKA